MSIDVTMFVLFWYMGLDRGGFKTLLTLLGPYNNMVGTVTAILTHQISL